MERIKLVKEEIEMGVRELLIDEVVSELRIMNDITSGCDQHKQTADVAVKLMDRLIEFEKLYNERNEYKLKLRQFEEDKKDRLIKNCIAVAGIIVPVGVTIWGTLKSFEFEKEGTITTMMGRGFINKLLPKK